MLVDTHTHKPIQPTTLQWLSAGHSVRTKGLYLPHTQTYTVYYSPMAVYRQKCQHTPKDCTCPTHKPIQCIILQWLWTGQSVSIHQMTVPAPHTNLYSVLLFNGCLQDTVSAPKDCTCPTHKPIQCTTLQWLCTGHSVSTKGLHLPHTQTYTVYYSPMAVYRTQCQYQRTTCPTHKPIQRTTRQWLCTGHSFSTKGL